MDSHNQHPSDPTEGHAPGHAAPADDMPFSEEEIKTLHSQDMAAATYVVGLMLFIFGVGVVLYSIIALVTWA